MSTGILLFFRSHITVIGGCLLLAGIVYAAVAPTYPYFLTTLNIGCALIILYGFVDENKRLKFGYKRGGLMSFGEVIGFCAYPRPGTSLLKALDQYADINAEDIEEIKLQTCNFGNRYLNKLGHYFHDSGVLSNTPIELVGVGNEGDLKEVRSLFPN